jgi:hypothetical protein
MIVIAGVIIGVLWGALLARRRKGRGFDIAQYAVGFGIAFGLLGMVLTVILERMV